MSRAALVHFIYPGTSTVDGWKDGWLDGWMDGWMVGWMGEYLNWLNWQSGLPVHQVRNLPQATHGSEPQFPHL